MSAYFIARVKMLNKEQYQQYLNVVPGIIKKFNGKPVVRSENIYSLEGPDENRRIVIIEFPSSDRAKEFYFSDEYQKAKKLRENAAIGEAIIVDGI